MARREPERRPDPVQWLRLRYAKRGPLRFASHRDIARTVERAVRRAGLPIASSSGFSPHPRLSYANPAPTGAASYAEYVEAGLLERVGPAEALAALGQAMPDGLPVTGAAESYGRGWADGLAASLWLVEGTPASAEAIRALLAAESYEVGRQTKNGLRRFDIRGAIHLLEQREDGALLMLLAHGEPLVRAEDVVTALRALTGGSAAAADAGAPAKVAPPALATRLAQGLPVPPDGPGSPDCLTLDLGQAALRLLPGEDDPRPAGWRGRCLPAV